LIHSLSAYSSVHGNKIRKLWKLLAKNDMLESASYEFRNQQACRVRDCGHQSATAMELFRHIRYHTVLCSNLL
jgi:hypothetical protein